MKNGEIILQNHLLAFAILLFIIGIINIWIAWKRSKEMVKNIKPFEEADKDLRTRMADKIEGIKKESW